MRDRSFVHLHVHSEYSLLDSTCRLDRLVRTARDFGMPAVAITDHASLSGAVEFMRKAWEAGIRPVVGSELLVADKPGAKAPVCHLVVLAENNIGYNNLVKLVSTARVDRCNRQNSIDVDLLAGHAKGLIGLSGCPMGGVPSLLSKGKSKAAEKAAREYAGIFGDRNFFLELQDHGLPAQRKLNKLLVQLGKKTGIGTVATNNVHYLKREHAAAHDVLMCLRAGKVITDRKRPRYETDQMYLKQGSEMEQLFKEIPDALDNAVRIAERCRVERDQRYKLHFPRFTAPANMNAREYMIREGLKGLTALYGIKDPGNPKDLLEKEVVERFYTEVAVIADTGFTDYFLVIADIVDFARRNDITIGPGRGSTGGSLVAYLLGISSIDPLHYGLIFERLLNPQRLTPPDIDLEFSQARCGEVIEYVRSKHGPEKVARLPAFLSSTPRNVVQDVCRVLKIPAKQTDKLIGMTPDEPRTRLHEILNTNPEVGRTYRTDKNTRKVLDIAVVLEGLRRSGGTHPTGLVLSDVALSDFVPLMLDPVDGITSQFPVDCLEQMGFVKLDFMGLSMLDSMHEALSLIRKKRGRSLDPDSIPANDKETLDLINRGETVGIFQLETEMTRDLIRQSGVDRFEDLVALIALCRPGPGAMSLIDDYLNGKTGRVMPQYDHAWIKPILLESHGVILYQEQVIKIACILAGYSPGRADHLRRVLQKRFADKLQRERESFIDSCMRHKGMEARLAAKIFDKLVHFAPMTFNKAHTVAHAILSYQCAYLKTHFPSEFMAAMLAGANRESSRLGTLVDECRRMKLKIKLPKVKGGKRNRPVKRV